MKLAKYLKPYRVFAIISPLMMMGEVLADLCLPYLMSFIVDYGILENGLTEIQKSSVASGIMSLLYGDTYTQMNIIVTFGVLMLLITLIGGFFGTFAPIPPHALRKDSVTIYALTGIDTSCRCPSSRPIASPPVL